MDLYYALTPYQLLSVVLHKMTLNENKAVLFISDIMRNSNQILDRLVKTKVFETVKLFPDKKILSERRRIATDFSATDFNIKKTAEIVSANCTDLDIYDNYYICADHFPLGIYYNSRNTRYYFFEEGNGQQSKSDVTVEHTIKTTDQFLYPIVVKLCLFGRNDNVINRYIDVKSQREGYEDEKAIDFCISDILRNKLSEKNKSQLRMIFDFEHQEINADNSVIFLPQHNVNLGVFTLEQQLHQSSLLLDYFADGYKKYIKPHPSDIFTDYSVFDDITILNGDYPVELLSLALNGKFSKGITAWSTSINSLSSSLENKVCFTSDIDNDYKLIHKYYATAKLIKEYAAKHNAAGIDILDIGTNSAMLTALFENCDDLRSNCEINFYCDAEEYNSVLSTDRLCVCICDKTELTANDTVMDIIKNSAKTVFTVFIDSLRDSIFLNNGELKNFDKISVVEINKKSLTELFDTDDKDEETERIYVYMSDTADKEFIEAFSFTKRLALTQMLIEANNYKTSISDDDVKIIYREIKTLEGILSATEKRVTAEAEKNIKLAEELDKDKLYISELEEKVEKLTAFNEGNDINILLDKLKEYVEHNEVELEKLEEITENQEKLISQKRRMQELNERIESGNYSLPTEEENKLYE